MVGVKEEIYMNKKIKTILMLFVLCALFTMFSTLDVSAKSITLDDNDNPDYVTVLGINDCTYEIKIDEESKIGYVYYETRGQYELIGTCEVLINDTVNNSNYILCYDGENSTGNIVITIGAYDTYVSYAEGNISNIFSEGVNVIITE